MKIAVPGYDTVETFPDGTPPEEIQRVLAEKYPPTPDQVRDKLKDPATPWDDITFEEFQTYRKTESDVTVAEGMGMLWDGVTEVTSEIAKGVPAAGKIIASGDVKKGLATTAEGAYRGTHELMTLGAKILNNVGEFLVPGDDEEAAFSRFLGIKRLDNAAVAARNGDANMLSDMFADEDIDQDLAIALSNVLDPSIAAGGLGAGSKTLSKAAGAPARWAGNTATTVGRKGGELVDAGVDAVGRLRQSIDDTLPGVGAGRAAITGAGTAGVMASAALGAIPAAFGLGGGALRGIGQSAGSAPTRIGSFRRIAASEPGTAIGRAAGRLTFLDAPIDSAIRLAAGGGTGAALGGVLGGLAEGEEGFWSGIGTGAVLGAGGAGVERLRGAVTGKSLDAAIQNDWQTFMARQDDTTANWARDIGKTSADKAQVMDLMGLLRGVTGDDVVVKVLDADDYKAAGGGTTAGFAGVVGDKPVVFLNGPKADLKTLRHETFHAIAKLDGYQHLVDDIQTQFAGQRAPDGTVIREGLYNQQQLDKAFRRYRNQLPEAMRGEWDKQPEAHKIEELGAEYFAAFLEGRNPNFLLTGQRSNIPGATFALNAIDSLLSRRAADKLERVTGALETRLFGRLKTSPALEMAYKDLVKARRKAIGAAELAEGRDVAQYTARDLGSPEVFDFLEGAGLARVDKKGRRVLNTPGATKKADKARASDIVTRLSELPEGGGLVATESGYSGKWFSPEQLSAVLKSAHISDKVKEALQALDTIIQEGHAANLTYGAATRKNAKGQSRYSHRIPISNRDVIPYSVEISKAGNIGVQAVDLSKLRKKAEAAFTKEGKRNKYSEAWETYADLKDDLSSYISALSQGVKPTAEIFGVEKRNLMNALLGARNTKGNPILPSNFKLTEANNVWRKLRLDRLIDASPLSDKVIFDEAGYERAKVNYSPDSIRVGTSLPTGKTAVHGGSQRNISGELVPIDLLADHMAKMDYPHTPGHIRSIADPEAKREAYTDWMADNLVALHDAFLESYRAPATLWYDGANLIADTMAAKNGYTLPQTAGVLAVLSPQKNWFMNVAQAEQVVDIWRNHRATALTRDLIGAELDAIIDAAEAPPGAKRKARPGESALAKTRRQNHNKRIDQKAKDARREILEAMVGKTVEQLGGNKTLQAWAIRVLAQSLYGRDYRVVSPSGVPMGIDVTKSGTPQKNGWGSTGEIVKAVSILEDGSIENISSMLGNEHKVRNFYNNIASPNSPKGDSTMDTHAVAAAHLMPYGASAKAVLHNFGAGVKGSKVSGISGTYHVYSDAYRKAAERVGLLPRQMQSITWEAVRLLYSPESRRDKSGIAKIESIWKNNDSEKARRILVSGELPAPPWAGAFDGGQFKAGADGLQEARKALESGGGLLFGSRQPGRTGSVSYSPAVDKAYLDAVKGGDMETAQRMVDEAAKRAGYTIGPVYHGTGASFDTFKRHSYFSDSKQNAQGYAESSAESQWKVVSKEDGEPLEFFQTKEEAEAFFEDEVGGEAEIVPTGFSPETKGVYLRFRNPLTVDAKGASWDRIPFRGRAITSNALLGESQRLGHDGLVIENVVDTSASHREPQTTYASTDPAQIKSAEPITKDNQGRPIPLSKRFNESTNDIRYSPSTLQPSRPFGNGGQLWTSPDGHKAIQINRRSKIRLYGPSGKPLGLYKDLESAQAKIR